jgi:hypothetical protein
MTESTTPARRARLPLSIWIVATVLPLLVSALAVALQLAWLPQLPDPVATHWGPGGADGFGPAWSVVLLTACLAPGIAVLFTLVLATTRRTAPTATHKLLAVTSLATACLVATTATTSIAVQRGLADARDAELDGWLAGAAFAVAALVAVVAWFALPKAVRPGAEVLPTEPLRLAPGERSVWIATARVSDGALVAILLAVGLATVGTVTATVVSGGLVWPLLLLPVVLFVLCALGIAWRVRVDASGILVRSLPLGWPRTRIRAGEIASVKAVRVEPLAEFGGWGWRWSPVGGFGVIARGGDAIQVERRDGRRFTVTVDDAETGAALLAGYAASATEIGERGSQGNSARGNG